MNAHQPPAEGDTLPIGASVRILRGPWIRHIGTVAELRAGFAVVCLRNSFGQQTTLPQSDLRLLAERPPSAP